MGKNYDTFKEIDSELKRLRLQSQIDKEDLKISIHNVKEGFTPGKLFGGVVSGIFSSGLLLKILTPVAIYAVGKFTEKEEQKKKRRERWWPFS